MRVHELTGAQARALRRSAPTLLAAALALAYLIVAPRSVDLAAQLFRVRLFGAEGFGLWDNWWYAGHDVLGYSVLFPALGWLISPQSVAALAAVATAAGFEALAHRHFGEHAWVGATWFGAATATNLLSGRLTFALGLLGATLTALALQRRRPGAAVAVAILTALTSPVAALFAALAGAVYALGSYGPKRSITVAALVVAGALLPVLALAVAFPEGGTEPFAFSALWPIPVLAAILLAALPARERVLRAGVALYTLGCLAAYLVDTPVGGNAARLGVLVAGPLVALVWWRRRPAWLLLIAVPLLYVQWQAAVRDVTTATGDPSTQSAYYQPLLHFLARQTRDGQGPFRIEIPFTRAHWEAYEVAGGRDPIPLARGWERQLDIEDNHLFYAGTLTARHYERWLHQLAVRFVALPDVPLDYSAVQEGRLIDRGLPYLRLVWHSRHWRVYAVAHATPIVSGAARLTALGPDSLTLDARRRGTALVRVRYSPYWRLSGLPGCVRPAGAFTAISFRRAGPVRLVIDFSLSRIGARSPLCD